jgi:hypothetical protein
MLKTPWTADLQDPIYDGISKSSIFLSRIWIRRILRTAQSVAQVSPEWASENGKDLGIAFNCIRHAIPEPVREPLIPKIPDLVAQHEDCIKVFYGGSISKEIQSLTVLKATLSAAKAAAINVKVFMAGNAVAYNYFKYELGEDSVIHLGWLNLQQMNEYIFACDCTLVIPCSHELVCIPSKFYELCSYPKPIWVIGNDTGAFTSLFEEWQHPQIPFHDIEFQLSLLRKANIERNFDGFFTLNKCKGKYLFASGLGEQFERIIDWQGLKSG